MSDIHHDLDTSGLDCPLPLLHTKKALARMSSGEVLQIIATDPGAVDDLASFARQSGHELLESRRESDKYYFLMRKG